MSWPKNWTAVQSRCQGDALLLGTDLPDCRAHVCRTSKSWYKWLQKDPTNFPQGNVKNARAQEIAADHCLQTHPHVLISMSWVETFSPPETKNRTQHDATRQLHLIKGRLQTFPVQTGVSIKLCMFVLQSIWSTLYNVLHSQVLNWAKSSSLLDSKNSWCQPCYLTLGITHTITAYFCRTNPFSTPPFQQVRCLWFQISKNEVGTVDILRPGKCCLQQGALHTVQEVVSNPQLSNPAAHWFIVEIRKAVFINPH